MARDPRFRPGPFAGPGGFDPWGDPMFRDPWERRRRDAQRRALEEQRRAAEERERLLAARREQARQQAAERRVPRWRQEAEERLRREQERRMADRRREAQLEAQLEAEQQRRLEALRDREEARAEAPEPAAPAAAEEATTPVPSVPSAAREAEVIALEPAAGSVEDEVSRVRARLERDAEAAVAREREALLNDFIEVLDDLDRALGSAEDRSDDLTRGVAMVRERFLGKLSKHGVERVGIERGERFDPKAHEAIATVPAGAEDDGRVVEVLRPAYRAGERIVRPAQVVVGRRA